MAKKKVHVKVGKRTLQLSNLDKVLYPDDGIVKAEVIQYYLGLAPTILTHIKGRPLSMVRFPDGIYGEQFYQKNRPDYAPDWVEHIRLGGDRKKEYIVATEDSVLVWLANLACLELHQMHSTTAHPDKPDYIVYDLDPPEGYDFDELKGIAFELKDFLERFGYHTFVKTTGGVGLHVLTPIVPSYSFDEVFQTAKNLMGSFIKRNARTTLHLKKEARKGRVLIDIYRNRTSQTIVSPYSLRGRKGGTVAAPVAWDFLKGMSATSDMNIRSTQQLVSDHGDAWESIRAWAVPLHTDKKIIEEKQLPPNERHKSPEQLEAYEKKRNFENTPEPEPIPESEDGSRFVIQRHHASRLHYDLRLEKDGVLLSWAIPRGMPPLPGIKRLAVQTEDHPLKYLTFEGEIPKAEYGGGVMWVYANGRYEITKEKKNGFYFRLNGQLINAEYRMHLMKGKEWLLERVDTPQKNLLAGFTQPMLAKSLKVPPSGDFLYEVKWDGIRAIFVLNEGELTIYSKNGNDITDKFPELNTPHEAFRANNGVFDGEIVCLDEHGKANFSKVIKRLMTKKGMKAEYLAKKSTAYAYLFDCLYLDGRNLMKDPLSRRRSWLEDSIRKDSYYRISEVVEDGPALFEAAKQLGVEGIMAKDALGKYHPGKRSDAWYKIKVKQSLDCFIIGYTQTDSDRQAYFGALQVAVRTKDGLTYRGKVGTGFDEFMLSHLKGEMDKLKSNEKAIDSVAHDEHKTVWIRPELKCEVEFSMTTNNGTLRDPVFKKLIID